MKEKAENRIENIQQIWRLLCIYVTFCQEFSSTSKKEEAVSAILLAYNLAAYPNSCYSFIVTQAQGRGAERMQQEGKPVTRRKPILHFHLFLLAEKYCNENSSYRELSQLVFKDILVFLEFQKLLTSDDPKFYFKIKKSQ